MVLGFPCDQFGNQEPGDEREIKSFCSTTYNVTFPMFAKIDVNGDSTHPLFGWLKDDQTGAGGGDIEWNFTKFLVDARTETGWSGATSSRRSSPTPGLTDDIEALLPS